MPNAKLKELAKLIRYYSLVSTTKAGSGHPTSSLSATDLMTVLMFDGYLKYNKEHPNHPNNDRLIFSKGHASPLFYSLWLAANEITEKELLQMRTFDSPLQGHPTPQFKHTVAATGSLGQGLSIGVGIALNAAKLDKLPYMTYVLLGDSEMAEGSNWEAMEIAAYYELKNLVGILDVNRLGQMTETMHGYNLEAYRKKAEAFGWNTLIVDGHNHKEIALAYATIQKKVLQDKTTKPTMIIAKTIKGKGVSFLEDAQGWHGKVLNKEQLKEALAELGEVDTTLRGEIVQCEDLYPENKLEEITTSLPRYKLGSKIGTRKVYGETLIQLMNEHAEIVVLEAETGNSTYSEPVKEIFPERYFQMFIAEQNMVGVAQGLASCGKKPYLSTFAAFITRAHDQIRMAQYSNTNMNIVCSHAGVSIGEDGASQMGLEDLALFRSILNSIVLYPSDALSAQKLLQLSHEHTGITYVRMSRPDLPVLYAPDTEFVLGGSHTLRHSIHDRYTIVAAGVTVHNALEAYDQLLQQGIAVRVIDAYSIKPLDTYALLQAADETKTIITVEDHYPAGGLGEAVSSALSHHHVDVVKLAVTSLPHSGTPAELMQYEKIDAEGIVNRVLAIEDKEKTNTLR